MTDLVLLLLFIHDEKTKECKQEFPIFLVSSIKNN